MQRVNYSTIPVFKFLRFEIFNKGIPKSIFLGLMILFIAGSANAQTSYSWIGASGGSWAVSTNWNPTRTTPAANDVMQFDDGGTYTVTAVPTQTIGKLLITLSSTITLQSAGTVTLSINGPTATNNLLVGNGSSLILGSVNSLTLNYITTASQTGDISGTLNVAGNNTFNPAIVATTVVTVSSSGTIVNSGGTITGSATALVFASGSNYNHTANGAAVPTAGWNANSNCNITGMVATAPTVPAQSYGNFLWSNTGQTGTGGISAGTTTIAGTLNINNGTLTMGGVNLTVNGITTVNSTLATNSSVGLKTFTDLIVTGTGTFNNTSGSAVTISGNLQNDGSFTAGTGLYTLSGAAKTISGTTSTLAIPSLTVTGTYVNSVSSLTVATALAGAGTLTMGANTTFTLTGTSVITGLNCTSNTPNTVVYNAAGVQTIKGTSYYNLTISKAGTTGTLGANTTVNNILTITGGTLADGAFLLSGPGGSGTLDMSTATASAITLTNTTANPFPAFLSNTFHATASTVNFNANAAQNVRALNYGNVTVGSTANTKTIQGTTSIQGNLTIGTSSTFAIGANSLTVSGTISGGTFSGGASSDLTLDGTVNVSVPAISGNLRHFIVNKSSGATATTTAALTVSGNLTVSGGTLINTAQLTGNAAGLVNVASGATWQLGSSATAIIFPSAYIAANITFQSNSTIAYGSTGAQVVSAVKPYQNLSILNASIKTCAAAITINGDLSVATGATLADGGFQIAGNASGSMDLSGTGALTIGIANTNNTSFPTGYLTANISLASTSTVTYNANVAQDVSLTPASYGNLTLTSTTAQTKTILSNLLLTGNLSVSGSTTLNIGNNNVTVNGNSLVTTTTASVIGNGRIILTGGSTVHQINGGGGAISFTNIELNDAIQGASLVTGATAISGTLTMTAGTMLLNNISLTLNGDFTGSGLFSAAVANTGSLIIGGIAGGSAGTINMASAPNNVIPTLTLNRTGAGASVTLGTATVIKTALNLTNGDLIGTSNLTLGTGTAVTLTTTKVNGTLDATPSFNLTGVTYNVTYGNAVATATINTGGELPATINTLTITNPTNGVNLNSNVTCSTGVTLTNGRLFLGNNDLTTTFTTAFGGSPGTNNFIAADANLGTGLLKKVFQAGVTAAYVIPLGTTSGVTAYSPVSLNFTANSAIRTVGVNVTSGTPPANGGSANYVNRFWTFTESAGGTYTYTPVFTHVAADVTGTSTLTYLNRYNGSSWTQYGTSSTATTATQAGLTETTGTLGGNTFSSRQEASKVYTWNATTGSADYTIATNWTPNRTTLANNDVLQFSNGGASTATNVPTQTIGRIEVSGNTNISLSSVAATQTLTFGGLSTGLNLDVQSGSTLQLSSTVSNSTLLAFAAGTQTATIAGTFIINDNTAHNNTYTATNAVTTVTGTVTNNGAAFTSTALNFIMAAGSMYNHSTNQAVIPVFGWDVASTCNLNGFTSNSTLTAGSQNFGNFIINCPGATGSIQASGSFTSVAGDLTLIAVGASFEFRLATTTSPTLTVGGNFDMQGGTFNFASSTGSPTLTINGDLLIKPGARFGGTGSTGAPTVNLSGDFIQTGGTFDNIGSGLVTFNFKGSGKSFSQVGTFTPTNYNFTINTANASLTLNNNIPVLTSRSFTVANGTLYTGSNIVTGAGAFILASSNNATLAIGDAGGITTTGGGLVGSIQVSGTRTFGTLANYIYNGTSAQVTGNGLTTCNNLTIDNAAGVTQINATSTTQNVIVTNQLTLTSGTYSVGGASGQLNTLTLNGAAILPSATTSLLTSAFSNLVFANAAAGVYVPSSVSQLNALTSSNTNATGLTMNSSITLNAAATALTLGGRLFIGNNDLTIATTSGTISGGSVNAMVVADGTGQLKKTFGAGATASFTFPVGDATGSFDYSPYAVTFSANSTQRVIGIRVTDADHPQLNSNGVQTDYVSRYWTFTDDEVGVGTYTYSASSLTYSTVAPTDLNGTSSLLKINRWDGANWSQLNTTVSVSTASTSGTYNETSGTIGGNEFTLRVNGSQPYVWQPTTGSADFQDANNWAPPRFSPVIADVLHFTNGGTSTATNVPTQTVTRILVDSNTDISLQSPAAATFSINGPTATDNLDIRSGSTLQLSTTGAVALTLNITTTANQKGNIAGTLVLNSNNSNNNNFTTSTVATTVVTVASGGTILNNGGVVTGTATTLVFANGSTYTHAMNAGAIPLATYNATSTCQVTGTVTTNPTAFSGTFGNVTWNCAGQTSATGAISAAMTVNGNLSVLAGTMADAGVIITGNASGTFSIAAGATYTTNRSATSWFPTNFIAANISFDPDGTFNYAGTSTHTIPNIPVTTYGILGITGGVVKTLSAPTTVSGISINTSGATLAGGGNLITGPGSGSGLFNIVSGGIFTMTNTIADPMPVFQNYTFGVTSTVNYNGVATQNIFPIPSPGYGNLNLSAASASMRQLTGNTFVQNTVTTSANNTLDLNGNTLAVSGTTPFSHSASATLIANGSGSTIHLNGSAAQTMTISGTITGSLIANLTSSNTNSVSGAALGTTPTTYTIGNLTISPGSYFSLNGRTMNLTGSYINNGTLIGNSSSSIIAFTGASPQSFNIGTYKLSQLFGMIINNASGVTLGAPVNIVGTTSTTGVLTLTSGVLTTTSSNLITVSNTAVAGISGGSVSSYVNGPLARVLPANLVSGNYTFPVGGAAYQLFELTNPTTDTSGTVTVTVQAIDGNAGGVAGIGLSALNTDQYWSATATGAGTITSVGAVSLTDASPVLTTSNAIGQSLTQTGTYAPRGGTVAVPKITSSSVVAPSLGFFVIGTKGGNMCGTYTVGAGPSNDFTNLSAATQAINNATITCDVIFELQIDYNSSSETFPISFSQFTYTGGPFNVTVRPAAGVTTSITGTSTATIISVNGADQLIFDGRQGGTTNPKSLTIANTSVSGLTFEYINDATYNTIKYCVVKGVNTTSTEGLIVYGTTTGTTGNDFNTVDNCDLQDGATTPVNMIYASGTSAKVNDNITISNNNIFNFWSASGATNGIVVSSNNSDWMITGNSFYQTTTRTATTGVTHVGIQISNSAGNNFIVTNNYIGGSSSNAGGSSWTVGGTVASRFIGIQMAAGTTTSSSIQGNVIKNFTWSSSSGATTLPGVWCGIYMTAGAINAGNTSPNVIGSNSGTGSISVTTSTTGGISFGIGSSSTGAMSIINNIIGSINLLGTTTSISHSFVGISATTGSPLTISGNSIGSTSTANSINASNPSTGTTGQKVSGIESTSSSAVTITGNTIANLSNAYAGTGITTFIPQVRGISSTAGTNTISQNSVHALSSASPYTGTAASASVIGISMTSTTTGTTVSENTIDSLMNSANAAVSVTGLHYSGATTGSNLIERNFIHTLDPPSTSSVISGIYVNAGNSTYQNNMIRLGIDASGNDITVGYEMNGIREIAGVNNYYHNSIYIGGNNVASSANTYAFQSNVITGTRAIQNNIFYNARSNASGSGKNYSIKVGAATGLTCNYNDELASGTGAVTGAVGVTDYVTFLDWRSGTGFDFNGFNIAPQFINPAGASSVVNLHIKPSPTQTPVESSGTNVAAVTTDFDGQSRAGFSPVDVGADAGNFTPYECTGASAGTASASPAGPFCGSGSSTVSINGYNFGAGISFQWQSSPDGTAGSFSDIPGATNTSYATGTITDTTFYRCFVVCTTGPASDTSSVVTIYVNPNPVVAIVADPVNAVICGTGSVTLTASGADTYLWSPGGATTAAITVSPSTTTTYTVAGTSFGCTVNATKVVTVSPATTVTSVTATPGTICSGDTSQLDVNLTTGYSNYNVSSIAYAPVSGTTVTLTALWTDDASTSVTLPFTFNYYGVNYTTMAVSTNGLVQLGSAGIGLNTTYSQTIPSASNPNNIIAACWNDLDLRTTGNINTITTGSSPNRIFSIQYQNCPFYNGIGGTGNVLAQIELFEGTGVIEIHIGQVLGTSTTSSLKTCGVENVNGTAAATAPGKNGSAWTVSSGSPEAFRFAPASNPTIFSWTPTTFLDDPAIKNPKAMSATATTVYTVTVTDALTGCAGTGNVTLTVNPLPSVIASNNAPFCSGTDDLNLTSNAPTAISYDWSGPGAFTSASPAPSIVDATNANSGTYSLQVTDVNGCKKDTTTTVLIYALPVVDITPIGSLNICTGQTSTDLQATGGNTYVWSTTETTSLITVSTGDTYIVTGTDGNTCQNSDTVVITESIAPADPIVTPSGPIELCTNDGINFIPVNLSCTNYSTDLLWSTSETTQSISVDYADFFNVTYTDPTGCYSTSNTVIIVLDDVDPTISCPNDTTITNSPGVCGATGVVLTMPVTDDNCSVNTVDNDAPSVFPIGNTTVTWTVTDFNGNFATCTQEVTVTDDEDPVISNCPADIEACGFVATWTAPTANDNCSILSFTSNYNSGATFPSGTTTVTYTAEDVNGNTSTCSFDVTTNPIAPDADAGTDQSVATSSATLAANAAAPGLGTWTVITGSGSFTPNANDENATVSGLSAGLNTFRWTISNPPCADTFDDVDITFANCIPPVISACPSNISQCDVYTASWTDPTATGTTPTVVCVPASGSTFSAGVTTVTCTATNGCGSDQCSFTVTVNETPVISACPSNISQCDVYTASWTDPTASGVPAASVVCVPASGSTFSAGVTTVTCTATNACGSDQCSFTVTINESPVISACPTNISQCDVYTASWTDPTASGVPAASVVCVPASGSTFSAGVTTVTCTATNACGSDQCSFTVTVNETPVISACPANISQCNVYTASWTDPTATGVPAASVVCVPASGSTFSAGVTTVTCTATNACGSDQCSFTVTVNESPVISACPSNISQCDVYTASWTDPTASGVPAASVVCVPASGSTFSAGVTTVTCTATNACGSDQCSFTVTISTSPTVSAGADQAICYTGTATLNGSFGGAATSSTWTTLGDGTFDDATLLNAVYTPGPSDIISQTATLVLTTDDPSGPCDAASDTMVINILLATPSKPAVPTGPSTACTGDIFVYSIPTVPTAVSYTWTSIFPAYASVVGNGTSATMDFFGTLPIANSSWPFSVYATNACGNSPVRTFAPRNKISQPGFSSGLPVVVCQNTNGVVYSVNSVSGATSYTWTITGSGAAIQGSNTGQSITVNFSTFTSVTISVTASNQCMTTAARVMTVNSAPVIPGTVTGTSYVCPFGTYQYSVIAVPGASSYIWTGPAGSSVAGTSNVVNITFGASIPGGSLVSVKAVGTCSNFSPLRSKGVASGIPNVPSSISGLAAGQCGETGVSYSITPNNIPPVSSYTWSVNNGATISGPNNLSAVVVDYPSTFSNVTISVVANNTCGSGNPRTLLVLGAPNTPVSISGTTLPCASAVEQYCAVGSVNATSYIWSVPTGATILGSPTGQCIQVLWGTAGGNINCTASNNCGVSGTRVLSVSVPCRQGQVLGTANELNVQLYPNPVVEKTTLKFNSIGDEKYLINFTNVIGQRVMDVSGTATDGVNMVELDLGNLAKGVYYLQLICGDYTGKIKVVVE